MLTYLQQLGMEVRACGSEDQAVACLRLQGQNLLKNLWHVQEWIKGKLSYLEMPF